MPIPQIDIDNQWVQKTKHKKLNILKKNLR